MNTEWYQGQAVRVWWLFPNKLTPVNQSYTFTADGNVLTYNGALIDPTTVTIRVRDTNGLLSTATFGGTQTGPIVITIVKDGIGAYYADVVTTSVSAVGLWTVGVIAAGNFIGYGTMSFVLLEAPV